MAEEESQCHVKNSLKRYRRLKLSLFEQAMIGAMILVLALASADAMDGKHIGNNDSLAIAKLQGQQGLMASVFKLK